MYYPAANMSQKINHFFALLRLPECQWPISRFLLPFINLQTTLLCKCKVPYIIICAVAFSTPYLFLLRKVNLSSKSLSKNLCNPQKNNWASFMVYLNQKSFSCLTRYLRMTFSGHPENPSFYFMALYSSGFTDP